MTSEQELSPQTTDAKRFYGTYIVVCSALIYFFNNGMTLFVPPNLFPRLMAEFQATAAEVSRTTSLTLLVAAVMAPFTGALVDRLGPLRILRVGLVWIAICFAFYPFASSLNQLYLIHVGLGFGLSLSGLTVNVVLLSRWFVAKRGRVVGLLVASSSLAGFVLPQLISPLVNHPEWGWRWGFGLLSLLFCIIPLTLGWTVIKESPAEVNQHPDGSDQPSPETSSGVMKGLTLSQALRTRTLWCLAVGSACLWFSIVALNSQATIYFEQEVGLTPQWATRLYSLLFACSMAGKFLFGYLSDSMAKHRVMLMTTLILLAGCLLLFRPGSGDQIIELTRSVPQLVLFALVWGLGFGGSFTMIQLTAIESFGPRSLGKLLGIIVFIDSIAASLGTLVISQMKTSTGSYLVPFLTLAGIAVVAVINVLMIRPPAYEK
jgi:MFS family permease